MLARLLSCFRPKRLAAESKPDSRGAPAEAALLRLRELLLGTGGGLSSPRPVLLAAATLLQQGLLQAQPGASSVLLTALAAHSPHNEATTVQARPCGAVRRLPLPGGSGGSGGNPVPSS
ncbi:hypothetical protein ABPG75_001529 [Micractinium tetrahymenae]